MGQYHLFRLCFIYFIIYIGVQFFSTFRADTVAENSIAVFTYVFLNRFPISLIITYLFTIRAYRNKPLQCSYFIKSLFQFYLGFYSCQKLCGVKWFYNIINTACLKASDNAVGIGFCCQENYRYLFTSARL